MPEIEGNTILFCAHAGCGAMLDCESETVEVVRSLASLEGWSTDEYLNQSYCPVHRGESGVGAMVPAFPPYGSPGIELELEREPELCGV